MMVCTFTPTARRSAVAGLLAIHAALLAWHGATMSPVTNEVPHLPAGISHWKFGWFDLYRQNPPLVRMVGALPVMAAGAKYDWSEYDGSPLSRSEGYMGGAFVQANGERTCWLYTLARWACIPFSLVGAWVAYKWAGEMYGWAAGMVALSLYCFCPNLVGHGALLMPDAPSAALGLAASYSFWRWLKAPTWEFALLAGVVLGAAELTKTTLLALVPVWPLLWVVYRLAEKKSLGVRGWLRETGMIALRYAVAWCFLNAGYLFTGTFKPLGEYQFRSLVLNGLTVEREGAPPIGNRFADTWMAGLPVPLPADYVQGIDMQRNDFERKGFESYMRGEWRDRGWWYYYLYVLAVKTPLGALVLLGLAIVLSAWRRQAARRDELLLLAPAAAILVLVSSQTGFNVHGRYVWPVIPYLYVFAGQAGRLVSRATPKRAALVLGLLVASVGSMLWHCPYSVSYFNEAAGGPKNGSFHLHYSSVSWGQDLLHLKRWVDAHPDATPFYLLHAHGMDSKQIGIEYGLPPFLLEWRNEPMVDDQPAGDEGAELPDAPGWYAIDVDRLRSPGGPRVSEHQPILPEYNERSRRILRTLFAREPDAMAGYSIFIYRVSPEETTAVGGSP